MFSREGCVSISVLLLLEINLKVLVKLDNEY